MPPEFVQYPRSARPTDPYYRAPGVYLDSLSDAWKLVKEDLGTWIGATIVSFILLGLIYFGFVATLIAVMGSDGFAAQGLRSNVQVNLISLPFGALYTIVLTGLISVGVKKLRGESRGITDIFFPWRKFLPLFVLVLAINFLVFLGLMLLCLPGIYVSGLTALAPTILVFGGEDPIAALKTNFTVVRNYGFQMFGLMFVLGLILFAGAVACGFGLLLAAPVYAAMMALHYHYFFPPVTNLQQPVDYSRPMA